MTIKPTPQSLARICLPIGTLTIAAGVAQDRVTLALGGFAFICVGLTAIVVHAIRDTAEERRGLQQALREVEADRMKVFAQRVRVDDDAERLCRLSIKMEQDHAAQREADREELLAELEDRRAEFVQQGFDIGLNFNDRGVIDSALHPRPEAKVIQLASAMVPSKGHGAYSPS